MKLFFDTEFTGLHQNTTLISLGIVDENGNYFYAEFTDYAKGQVTDWIEKNVISNLIYTTNTKWESTKNDMVVVGDSGTIQRGLIAWLSHYKDEPIEMWSDCLSYDWVLFNSLVAKYENGYPQLPYNVSYIPFDICTVFKMKGIDPDISRKEYSGIGKCQHNALNDALMIRACYNKLMEER